MDLDGTSRDAVWSMSRASNAPTSYRNVRGSASLGRASTVLRTPRGGMTESNDRASSVGQGIGSDVGSEVAEMV